MPGALPAGGSFSKVSPLPISGAGQAPLSAANPKILPKPAPAIAPTSGGNLPSRPFVPIQIKADYQQISNLREALRPQTKPQTLSGQRDLAGGDRPVEFRTTAPKAETQGKTPKTTQSAPKTAKQKPASPVAQPKPVNNTPQSVGNIVKKVARDLKTPMPDRRGGTGAVVDQQTFSGPNLQYNPFADSLIPALRTPVKARPKPAGFANPAKPAAPAPLTKPQPAKPTAKPKFKDPPPPAPNPWADIKPAPKPAAPAPKPRKPGKPLGDRLPWPFNLTRPQPTPRNQPLPPPQPAPLTQPPGGNTKNSGGKINPIIPEGDFFTLPENSFIGKNQNVEYQIIVKGNGTTVFSGQNVQEEYRTYAIGPINISPVYIPLLYFFTEERWGTGINFELLNDQGQPRGINLMPVRRLVEIIEFPSDNLDRIIWRFEIEIRRTDGTTPEEDARQAGDTEPTPPTPPTSQPLPPAAERPRPQPLPPFVPWPPPDPKPEPPPKPEPEPFPPPPPVEFRPVPPPPDLTPEPPPWKEIEEDNLPDFFPFPGLPPTPQGTNQNKNKPRPKPKPNPRPKPRPNPRPRPKPNPNPEDNPDPTPNPPNQKDRTPKPPKKRDRIKPPRPKFDFRPIKPIQVEPDNTTVRPPQPLPPPPKPEPPNRKDDENVVNPIPIPPPQFIDVSFPQPQPVPQPPITPTPPPNLPTNPCESNQCTTAIRNDIKGLRDSIPSLVSAGGDAANFALLNVINTKLGDQIPGGIGGFLVKFAKSIHLDKIYNGMSLILQIHNAAILSRNLGESLGFFLDNGLALLGLKKEDETPLDISGTLGSAAGNFIKGIIGEPLYNGILVGFQRLSAIYGAAMGVIDTIVNTMSGLAEGLEIIGSYTGKIGNSLKKGGVILENAYNWMDENVRVKTGRFAAIQRVTDGIESAENVVNNLTEVTEIITETQDQVAQTQAEFARIRELANVSEAAKQVAELGNKGASQGGKPTTADKLPGEPKP